MKKTTLFAVALSASAVLSAPAVAGDPVAGKQKAGACVVCHGNETSGGLFYTLQLAGRNADKLTIKTMKYKTGKKLHPMMTTAALFVTEKEIEDISAYYQAMGKPALVSPFFTIQGDDDTQQAAAGWSAPAAVYAPMYAPAAGNWGAKGY
jgi:cytochrome c553